MRVKDFLSENFDENFRVCFNDNADHFNKFMTFKKTEALASRIIKEYIHFEYLIEFLADDMTKLERF